jgi:hypothetical protein
MNCGLCSNYWLQLDVDIGSSSVAKGVVNLVIGYLSKLVIEMAFLIQVSCTPNNSQSVCCLLSSNVDLKSLVNSVPR